MGACFAGFIQQCLRNLLRLYAAHFIGLFLQDKTSTAGGTLFKGQLEYRIKQRSYKSIALLLNLKLKLVAEWQEANIFN